MDLGSILLGVALLLGVAFIVARPLLDRAEPGAPEPGQAETLLFEQDRVLSALRDLDFDHATGKLPDDDYAAQRARLVAEGTAVLKQLDAWTPSAASAAPATPDLDAELEAAIARRRSRPAPAPAAAPRQREAEIEAAVAKRRQAARFCSQCGQPLQPGDRFCGACGAAVKAEQAQADS